MMQQRYSSNAPEVGDVDNRAQYAQEDEDDEFVEDDPQYQTQNNFNDFREQ